MERMVTALQHRGPDGRDITPIDLGGGRQLVFGHARLSILDLTDHAAQPMYDAATRSWLIYNGEIYNFARLRSELQALGHSFQSTGDTEVFLKALVQWGPEAMHRVRGMYAFAFWDGRTRQLVLGRDPFGIKPLLLARAGDTFVFASEVRAIAASRLVPLNLHPAAVRSYLTFGCVIEPATIFQEVASIPPGCVVLADAAGRLAPPRRILTLGDVLARHRQPEPISYADAVERTRVQLQRSVSDHLVSDVPVGVFLSGGIDSSVVAAMADRTGIARDLRYLTICFAEQDFSELGYAEQVARQLSGRHEKVQLDAAQMTELLPRALASMDQPSVDGINTYMVSKVARQQGVKVVLSGLGGDELFAGYTTFWKAPLLGRFPRLLPRVASLVPARAFKSEGERLKLLYTGNGRNVQEAYLLQRSLRWDARVSGIRCLGSLADSALAMPEAWDLLSIDHRQDSYRRISYYESVFYMRNQLLRDSDIMSSANSIELRVPFLDLDLLEAAWSIPGRHHCGPFGGGKRLLKEVLNEAIPGLPLNRRKMGFVFPWKHWLRNPQFFGMVADTIHTPALYGGMDVDPVEGRAMLSAFQQPRSAVNWAQVWSLFVLLDWKKRTIAA